MIAEVPPANVAYVVQAAFNKKFRFANQPARVTGMKCISSGGGYYLCKATLHANGRTLHLMWDRIKVNSDGSWSASGMHVI